MHSRGAVKGRSAGWAIQYAQARQKRREGGKESKGGAFLARMTLRTHPPCRR